MENGYLARRTYKLKYKPLGGVERFALHKTEYFIPTEAQWRVFWEKMDTIKIWSWKKRYDPSDIGATVYDGGDWELTLSHQGRKIHTGGENAGPKPGHPATTVVGWDGWNKQLDNAASLLTKTKE